MPEKHRGRLTTDNPKTMRVDVRLTEKELVIQALCEKVGKLQDQLAEMLNDKQKAILLLTPLLLDKMVLNI